MSNMVGGYEIGEGSTPKKRSKSRSEVWEHFTKLQDVNGTDTGAKCKHCHKDLRYTLGTTSHLRRHLASCSEAPEQVGTQFSKKPKRKIISKPLEKAKKQKSVGINQPPTIALLEAVRNFDITSEKIREVHVKSAILADFPFAHPDIKKAWSSLMVMDTEKEICGYYQRQKGELINELGNLTSGVSFSCDIIEAGWISISAHFINNEFKLVKRLIGFKKVDFKTPISCKADVIESCISDWKLENKIFSINTIFNLGLHCSLMEKFSTKSLLETEEMVFSCFSKIETKPMVSFNSIYIIMKSYLEITDKIIEFLRDVLETKIKTRKFNAIAKEMGLPPIDEDWFERIAMGWQGEIKAWAICCSVAKLFKDALSYKAVFYKCAVTEPGEAPVSQVDPQIISWQDIKKYIAGFDAFNNTMGTLSNFKYPTSNVYFPSVVKITDESYLGSYFDLCDQVPHIFCVSCVLDPRYKLTFLEYYLKHYGSDGAEKYVETRELLETLFVAHAREGTNNGGSSSSARAADTQEDNSLLIPTCEDYFTKGFRRYLKNLKTIDRSEMNQYLIEDTVDMGDAHFDLLGWWKENSLRYPVLSRMARNLLAIPVCLYSVEENLGLDLSVLKGVDPELVEAAICSKDWILTNA